MRAVFLLLPFLLLSLSAMAQSTDPSTPRTVTVQGQGEIMVVPDQATVRFGVVSAAADPEQARQINADASARALNALRALGIPERKLRLDVLSLQPKREYDQQTRQWIQDGYEATRNLTVVIEDLDQLPLLIAEIVQEGANRLNSLEYGLQDREATVQDALRQALENARAKAVLMAETFGDSLGPVLRITEQSASVPHPTVPMARMASAASKAAPEPDAFAAGEMTIRTSVQVVFTLQ